MLGTDQADIEGRVCLPDPSEQTNGKQQRGWH